MRWLYVVDESYDLPKYQVVGNKPRKPAMQVTLQQRANRLGNVSRVATTIRDEI